jgi:hypothetical protein
MSIGRKLNVRMIQMLNMLIWRIIGKYLVASATCKFFVMTPNALIGLVGNMDPSYPNLHRNSLSQHRTLHLKKSEKLPKCWRIQRYS